MQVDDKLWMNCNKAPLRLWQTQLSFGIWSTSSACGVSSEHLNYKKHPMVRSLYRFHMYYDMRRVLKRLLVPLPHQDGFNTDGNPYTNKEFFKICENHDPMRYREEKFSWTYQ